jgi:outer membrane lipopolysaccharide assembly protein LptE/RlpB
LRRRGPALRGAALLLIPATLAGCGYALVGTGRGSLPEDVKTVWVPTFVNDTQVVSLEQRLTSAVIREFAARGRLKPAASLEAADAVLNGRLTSFSLQPVRFDTEGRAVEYQIAVTARLQLVDRKSDKTLFEQPAFLVRQPYNIPLSSGSYFNPETAAVDVLTLPFARTLVTTILEGF